ncbi:MAG: response regulator [Treponema sp.]|nr:response regulator [Treponema sp.]
MAERKKVLAVDDNPVQLTLFKNILSNKYDLFTANSATNALKFMNESEVDIILLDIEMPNINGFQFLTEIRTIPSYMLVPIIIVSGKTGQEFFAEARKSSAADVLGKPVVPESLIESIEKVLNKPE